MSFAEKSVFQIDDLRNYIFTYLRSKPEKICIMCNDTLVWDKKEIKKFVEVTKLIDKNIIPGTYCIDCYYRFNHFSCVLC